MPLSTRYNVMINDALNAIPIQQPEDFALIIKELRKILSGRPNSFNQKFKNQIETLYEFLSEADLYVKPAEIKRYRALVRAVIQQKIDAFKLLTGEQKNAIIAHNLSMKVITAANHAKIKAHDTPENRLVSEEIVERGSIEEENALYHEDILASEEHDRITLCREIEKERKQQRTALVAKYTLFFIFIVAILTMSQMKVESTLNECEARLPGLPPSMLNFLSAGAPTLFANLLYKLIVSIKPCISALTRHHFFSSDLQHLQQSPQLEAYARFLNEVMRDHNVELESHVVPRITTA